MDGPLCGVARYLPPLQNCMRSPMLTTMVSGMGRALIQVPSNFGFLQALKIILKCNTKKGRQNEQSRKIEKKCCTSYLEEKGQAAIICVDSTSCDRFSQMTLLSSQRGIVEQPDGCCIRIE